MKSLCLTVAIALSLVIVSCSDNSVEPVHPTNPSNPRFGDIPTTAQEAEMFYHLSENILEDYSVSKTLCKNFEVIQDSDNTLITFYKQFFYAYHGMTVILSGQTKKEECVFIALGYIPTIGYLDKGLLMINGDEITTSKKTSNKVYPLDVRAYVDDWLIILCETGMLRGMHRQHYWMVYNTKSKELRDFGTYGPFYKN